jgi:hypothetical protein
VLSDELSAASIVRRDVARRLPVTLNEWPPSIPTSFAVLRESTVRRSNPGVAKLSRVPVGRHGAPIRFMGVAEAVGFPGRCNGYPKKTSLAVHRPRCEAIRPFTDFPEE